MGNTISDEMKAKKFTTPKKGPEAIIQANIVKKLTLLGWHVEVTHGNVYQFGFPDLYCIHIKYGTRWIEVKDPKRKGDLFTAAQLEKFPLWNAKGVGIWILTSDSDFEYAKLFKPYNWTSYLFN